MLQRRWRKRAGLQTSKAAISSGEEKENKPPSDEAAKVREGRATLPRKTQRLPPRDSPREEPGRTESVAAGRRASPLQLTGLQAQPRFSASPPPARRPEPLPGDSSLSRKGGGTAEPSQGAGSFFTRGGDANFPPPTPSADTGAALTLRRPPEGRPPTAAAAAPKEGGISGLPTSLALRGELSPARAWTGRGAKPTPRRPPRHRRVSGGGDAPCRSPQAGRQLLCASRPGASPLEKLSPPLPGSPPGRKRGGTDSRREDQGAAGEGRRARSGACPAEERLTETSARGRDEKRGEERLAAPRGRGRGWTLPRSHPSPPSGARAAPAGGGGGREMEASGEGSPRPQPMLANKALGSTRGKPKFPGLSASSPHPSTQPQPDN